MSPKPQREPVEIRHVRVVEYRAGGTAELPGVEEAGAGGWRFPRWGVFLIGLLLTFLILAAVAGGETVNALETLAYGLIVLPLLLSAWMAGLAITEPFARRGCFDDSPWPEGFRSVTAVALGLGAQALAMMLLGVMGLVPVKSPGLLWILPVLAAAAGVVATRRFLARLDRRFFSHRAHRGDWLMLAAAVPIAMLLLSATFPPGSLWNSEAHGYDVMEYHLQLPREYGQTGSVMPVAHNIYSYLPANVEMLYLLLMQQSKSVMSDPSYLWGTFPAQVLHVLLMLLTAAAIALMPARNMALGATGRAVAVLVFLGVPWTIVTGSLAYNEGGMMLTGVLALGVTMAGQSSGIAGGRGGLKNAVPRGVLIGLLLGLAVGCKLTAGLFFALPVAALLMLRATEGGMRSLSVAAIVATALYAPWALRAAAAGGGNPLFPVASTLLGGRDGWTPQQADAFDRGHSAPPEIHSFEERLRALGRSSLLDSQWSPSWSSIYLWTSNRPPDEGVWKRLGLLWIFLPLGVALAFVGKAGRVDAGLWLMVLAIQCAAWMYGTHLQARFLLPAAVPLALLFGRGAQGLGAVRDGVPIGAMRLLVSIGMAAQALATIFLLLPEVGLLGGTHVRRPGQPPDMEQPIGELFPRQINVAFIAKEATAPPGADGAAVELPPPERVLLLGDSTAWRFAGGKGDVIYSTVFDRSIISDAVRMKPAQAADHLRDNRIHFVWIDWNEVARLRRTYGFDDAVTPDAIAPWLHERVEEIRLDALGPGFRGITLLRVRY